VVAKIKKPTLKSLKKRAWKMFSEFVRRRDADKDGFVSCFTCGERMLWKESHAGHAIPGRHNAVLLDPDIVKPQCPRDNVFLGGRLHVFATRLIKERGLEWWEEKLSNSRKAVKFSRSDLENTINLYKKKLETLET